jgi:hypothetical protein
MSGHQMPRWAAPATLVLAPFLLSACESSDVAAFSAATPDEIRNIQVAETSVTVETVKPHPKLRLVLQEELEKAVPHCARGRAAHRMDVAIVDFEDQNVAQAVLIGDEIELSARVRFTDLATDRVTGEYFVENSFFWGGLVGAAMMSDAERRLSRDFAENLCEDLFGVEYDAGKTAKTAAAAPSPARSSGGSEEGDEPRPADEEMCTGKGWVNADPVRPWEKVPCNLN